MKICCLSPGYSVHTQRWVNYFAERHDVHLISTHPTVSEKYNPKIKIHRLNIPTKGKISKYLNFILASFKIRKLLRKISPDIIHAHYVTTYGFYAAFSGCPFIVSVWGSDIAGSLNKSLFHRFLTRFVLGLVRVVHVNDVGGKEALISLGCQESKVKVLPWSIDTDFFSSRKRKVDEDSVVCLRSSFYYYNVEVFIRAIPHVLRYFPNTRFIQFTDEVSREKLNFLIKKLQIEKNVQVLGISSHEKILETILNSRILVDPFYRRENIGGIGHGILEAKSCCKIALMTDRPGVNNIKKIHPNLIFNYTDERDLAEKIVFWLERKGLRQRIGNKCREFVKKEYDWNKNMKKMENTYKELKCYS